MPTGPYARDRSSGDGRERAVPGDGTHGRDCEMLVLTRRAKQSVMIGDDVVVTVLEVRGDQVRLGIEAPRSVAVHREEVFDQVRVDPVSSGDGS